MLKCNQGLLLLKRENIFYFSRFTGSKSILFLTQNKKYIFIQEKYYEQVKQQCEGFEIILEKNIDVMEKIKNIALENSIDEILFEEETISLLEYRKLEKIGISLTNGNQLLYNLRMIKSEFELKAIKKSCEIVEKAISSVMSKLKLPMSERELALLLEFEAKKLGADSIDFLIVVSGERGALPHGRPSNKELLPNEFVTIDFGVVYGGYHSDITRTFFLGNTCSDKLKEIYNIVKEAQELGLSLVKEGVSTRFIDKSVREYIKQFNYDKFFVHGLGHGIGIEGHELPYLNETQDYILKENMVITIEPGIYIEGIGGVRIEDTVIVKKDGFVNLTPSSKEFKEIDLC